MSTFSTTDIINGNVDDALEDIAEAVSMRRKTLRDRQKQIALLKFSQGDKVRTKDNLSPKKISNRTATIIEKKRTRFVIDIDDITTGKWSGRVTVPASALEEIEDTEKVEVDA